MRQQNSIKVLLAAAAMLASSLALAAEPADRAGMEKDLAAARTRLDQAAKEVADLSRQLYGEDGRDAVRLMHGRVPQGAMLGVNIGGDQSRDDGVQVMGVSPSGPAQAAGLKSGDVIVAVDGKPLKKTAEASSARQLVDHMRGVRPGQAVKVDFLRDGKRMAATITATPAMPPMAMMMRERMPLPPGMEGMMPGMMDFMGFGHAFGALEMVSITPKLGQYFGVDKGLLVVRAPAEAGFRVEDGDVIVAIDGRVPESPGRAYRILGSYQPGEKVTFDVLRNRKRLSVEATMPSPGDFGPPQARPLQPRLPPSPQAAPVAPLPPPPKPAESA